jgi:hypothetical protein
MASDGDSTAAKSIIPGESNSLTVKTIPIGPTNAKRIIPVIPRNLPVRPLVTRGASVPVKHPRIPPPGLEASIVPEIQAPADSKINTQSRISVKLSVTASVITQTQKLPASPSHDIALTQFAIAPDVVPAVRPTVQPSAPGQRIIPALSKIPIRPVAPALPQLTLPSNVLSRGQNMQSIPVMDMPSATAPATPTGMEHPPAPPGSQGYHEFWMTEAIKMVFACRTLFAGLTSRRLSLLFKLMRPRLDACLSATARSLEGA